MEGGDYRLIGANSLILITSPSGGAVKTGAVEQIVERQRVLNSRRGQRPKKAGVVGYFSLLPGF